MGISGSGKTTVGAALAQRLGVLFADADDLHPPTNVATMSACTPFDDHDRLPWLCIIGDRLGEHAATGAVTSASALPRSDRDILRESAPTVSFVHLDGSREVVARPVAGRHGHFMKASMVDSQFVSLEPLATGEAGVALDPTLPVAELVDRANATLGRGADPVTVDNGGASWKK